MSVEDEKAERRSDVAEGSGRSDSQLRQVSRAMVKIYKEQFGRGPTSAHSYYTNPNTITCFLEGSLTPVEQTLAKLGEHTRLRDTRLLFQYADENAFRGAVETITGRRVVAFISGIDTEADVSIETFVLAPRDLLSQDVDG